jgi:hypothetical protein
VIADDAQYRLGIEHFESFFETVTERCLSPVYKARFMSLAASYQPVKKTFQRLNIFLTNSIRLNLPIPELRPPGPGKYGYVCICHLLLSCNLGNFVTILNRLALYSTCSPGSIIRAGRTARSPLIGERVLHSLELDLLLTCFFLGFSLERENFARVVRAMIPLPKGTEVLWPYKPSLCSRAVRRESLKRFGFVCNCELCALPSNLSKALDTKIKLANEAAAYLDHFCIPKLTGTVPEADIVRAVELLDAYMSTIIGERLYFQYTQFNLSLRVLAVFGKPALVERVGRAILRLYRRHLGDRDGLVEVFSSWLDATLRIMADMRPYVYLGYIPDDSFNARLEKTVSTIISSIESLS